MTWVKQTASTENPNTPNESKWNGKTWLMIGDSITDDAATDALIKYHQLIADRTGVIKINEAKLGTGWLADYGASTPSIYKRMDAGAYDVTADLITIFAGTNDWYQNRVLGTFGDIIPSMSTFYGAVEYVIKGLITKHPTKTIAVFTPLPRNNNWGTNTQTKTLEEYVDAIIKVCRKYSVPVLDLYRESNMYAFDANFRTAYMPDGLHPNNAGHAFVADKIQNFIESL